MTKEIKENFGGTAGSRVFRLGRFSFRPMPVLLVTAFLVAYGQAAMRNFDLRMSRMYTDDGPILYAHAFKSPELFAGDYQLGAPIEDRVTVAVATSAMHGLPAFAWKYINVPPYLSAWLITLVQGLGIGMAVYVLTSTMTGNRLAAALAVVFAYAATPWGWDPANYGTGSSWNFVPYPAYLAFTPILLSFACLLKGRDRSALALLLAGGLIHPNMTLYACLIVGLFWLWEPLDRSGDRPSSTCWKPFLRRAAGLLAVGIITVAPAAIVMWTVGGGTKQVDRDELMAGYRINQHIWPWGDEVRWPLSTATAFKWVLLACLSWRFRESFVARAGRLWLASLIAFGLLGLSHALGGLAQNTFLLNLIGLRSYTWVALISLPLVMHYWTGHFARGHWPAVVAVLLCLALPLYADEYALFWPLIAVLALSDVCAGRLSLWRFRPPAWAKAMAFAASALVLVAWIKVFLDLPYPSEPPLNPAWEHFVEGSWSVLGELPEEDERKALVKGVVVIGTIIALMATLLRFRWGTESRRIVRTAVSADNRDATPAPQLMPKPVLAATILIAILYGCRFLSQQWEISRAERRSPQLALLDVQRWARRNSSPEAVFVVADAGGWRTMARRRQLEPFTREAYAYVVPREAQEHRQRLLRFYGITPKQGRRLRGSEIYYRQRELFHQFDAEDYRRFASEFGATHLVLAKSERTAELDLPRTYENDGYFVFRLQAQAAPAGAARLASEKQPAR